MVEGAFPRTRPARDFRAPGGGVPGSAATDRGVVSSPSVTPAACHLPLAGEEFGNSWLPGIGEAYAVSRGCAPLAGLAMVAE